MQFANDEHERFYNDHADITARGRDYAALVYTLGISGSCRQHFARLYDAKDRSINPDALADGWQTGSSRRIARAAFNLFTYQIPEGESAEDYTPKELFSSLDGDARRGMALALYYFA